MPKDVYTIVHDFSNDFHLDLVKVKQVVYSDGRLFQKFLLEKRHMNMTALLNEIKKDKGITDMLHWVHPFAIYAFGGGKLSITFKKDLQFTEQRAKRLIEIIINKY